MRRAQITSVFVCIHVKFNALDIWSVVVYSSQRRYHLARSPARLRLLPTRRRRRRRRRAHGGACCTTRSTDQSDHHHHLGIHSLRRRITNPFKTDTVDEVRPFRVEHLSEHRSAQAAKSPLRPRTRAARLEQRPLLPVGRELRRLRQLSPLLSICALGFCRQRIHICAGTTAALGLGLGVRCG